jgi:hypothetical protein
MKSRSAIANLTRFSRQSRFCSCAGVVCQSSATLTQLLLNREALSRDLLSNNLFQFHLSDFHLPENIYCKERLENSSTDK